MLGLFFQPVACRDVWEIFPCSHMITVVVPFLRSMLAVRSYWIMLSAMDCTLLITWKIMKTACCGQWITLVCAILYQLYMADMYSYTYISLNSPFNECTMLYHRVRYSFAKPVFGNSHNFSNEYQLRKLFTSHTNTAQNTSLISLSLENIFVTVE